MGRKSEQQAGTLEAVLISQAKAAEMCGMTRAAIQDLVRRKHFRSVEVDGRALVYRQEIEAFAAERK